MIKENDIRGLLRIEDRCIDGKEYLYYDISSLQPIRRMYEHKGLSGIDIKVTVRNIIMALKEADDHMLDISNIILSPSCIYTDPDDRRIYLMFYPYQEEREINGMTELAEFFLERIERSDADAALFAYEFYKTVRKENYVLADIESIADDSFPHRDSSGENNGSAAAILPATRNGSGDEKRNFIQREHINICKRTPDKKEGEKKIPFVLIAGGFLVAAIICFLGVTGVIPGIGETVEDKIVAGALAVSFMVALVVFIISHFKKGNPEVNAEKNSANTGFDRFFDDLSPNETNTCDPVSDAAYSNDQGPNDPILNDPAPGIPFGKTVFLCDDNEEPDNILEDRKGKKYKIDHFPFLIGKMADSADLVLNDKTVSRIHARITMENDHYFIQDCNSTNGTFLNGMELKGDEMAMLTKNDEIEIGHVKLNYR